MLLHEIISVYKSGKKSVLIENLIPYKKSLLTYYAARYTSDPLLLIVSVSNAAQYGLICPMDDAIEAINTYFDGAINDAEEMEHTIEVTLFNSIQLRNI